MNILRTPALIAFEAIVENGTVHGAAKLLGFTQTALTLRIQGLESLLSMTLFLRSRRGMALTEEGKALYQLCKGQKELEGLFFSQVSGSSRREVSLTVAGPTSAISTRVSVCCQKLYGAYPFLNLHFRVDDYSDRVELIRRGLADLAVVPPGQVPNEMESKRLKPDRFLLVASKNWKGRRIADILENERAIDFYESDPTTRKYLTQFQLDKHVKRSRIYANDNETLIRMFKAGIGYGTLAETVADAHLRSGELISLNQAKAIEDPLALVWYPRPVKPEYFEALVRMIT